MMKQPASLDPNCPDSRAAAGPGRAYATPPHEMLQKGRGQSPDPQIRLDRAGLDWTGRASKSALPPASDEITNHRLNV
jgi:hypothetical protein